MKGAKLKTKETEKKIETMENTCLVQHIHVNSVGPPEKQVLRHSSGLFPAYRTFMIKSFLFNLSASLFKGPYLHKTTEYIL